MIRLRIVRSLNDAETAWRQLEATAAATVFQSYRWQHSWSRHVSPSQGELPLIVIGENVEGKPLYVLPFAVRSIQGTTVLSWLGQEHMTYAMGLYAPGAAETIDAARLRAIVARICEAAPGLSALHLRNQPKAWKGVANPFATFNVQPSPNRSHIIPLTGDVAAQFQRTLKKDTRGKLRRSGARLAEQPGFAVEQAADDARRAALLETFLAQKAKQFSERGIVNPFADPPIAAFYRDLADARDGAPALLECAALHVAGEVVATATSASFGTCRHLLTLSLGTEDPELLRLSPGLTLMQRLMEQASLDGHSGYDLGAGEGQHKSIWQPAPVELVDSYLPLSVVGYAVTFAASGSAFAKRLIKSNARLWRAAQSARKLLRASRR